MSEDEEVLAVAGEGHQMPYEKLDPEDWRMTSPAGFYDPAPDDPYRPIVEKFLVQCYQKGVPTETLSTVLRQPASRFAKYRTRAKKAYSLPAPIKPHPSSIVMWNDKFGRWVKCLAAWCTKYPQSSNDPFDAQINLAKIFNSEYP